jgi:hypothetical protein
VAAPIAPYNLPVQRTGDVNPLAVASLVLGILGFVALPVLGAAFAIVLGEVAKRQIARSGQSGSAVATAGRILGAVWFVVALGSIVVFSVFTIVSRTH